MPRFRVHSISNGRLLAARLCAAAALLCVPWIGPAAAQTPNFIEFESGQVRPVAMSPDGTKLFAVNTPNDSLEIFNVTASGLSFQARVPVGLEPVAVAARTNSEVWVTNLLSDSVSIVSLSGTPHVTRTLLVGDEPRDIVFAGSEGRAFVATAHRGQQRGDPSIANVPGAGDPQLTTPGVGRADVWVFDPNNLGNTLGGTPVSILSFFTDTPRALAVSPDGNTVYVAGFQTGNQTTIIPEQRICQTFNTSQSCTLADGSTSPGGHLGPATDAAGEPAPMVSMIVKFNQNDGHWEDELGRVWDNSVRFTLPDKDVFAIDANGLTQNTAFAHVGTTLFNMATNPQTGTLYVSNSDAVNNVRFEGPGIFGGHTVQGHLAEMRITVILPAGGNVLPRRLNKHINYAVLANEPGFDPTAKTHSLATPTGIVVSPDGGTLYVTAFGSSKIGVFSTAALENDTFNPVTDSAGYIPVSGGGPSGLVLDPAHNKLYVLTRFDDAVKVIDLGSNSEVAQFPLPNPEPASVVQGRPFLYDAADFSANGEAACASCHIFGDKDELAWDLGNPDNAVTQNPIPINQGSTAALTLGQAVFGNTALNGDGDATDFHPMKGPMTTQTLRGLRFSGAMHWRGDRSNGFFGVNATDENLSFNNFIVAFQGLLGNATQPTTAQMQTFTNFQLQVVLPPNPVANLDGTLTAAQQRGQAFYGVGPNAGTRAADGLDTAGTGAVLGVNAFTCNGCHELDPTEGEFGTSKNASYEGIEQIFKIPHLRNMYTKIGMFGMPAQPFFVHGDTGQQGPQIRGFGFTNEGQPDTLFNFFSAAVFNPQANSGFPLANPDQTRRDVEQFMLAFPSDLAAIVGQQVTLTSQNGSAVTPRINLLEQRAGMSFASAVLGGTVTECDLLATVVQNGTVVKYLFNPGSGTFTAGNGSGTLTDSALRTLAATAGQEVTFTAVPPGSGSRMASSS